MSTWTKMTAQDFTADAIAPVQGGLFAAPDKCGTPDMFDSADVEDDAPSTLF